MSDEADDLMKTLLWILDVIVNVSHEDRQTIMVAYAEAQAYMPSIQLDGGSARIRTVMCFKRADAYRAAHDMSAVGWILTGVRERIAEHDLPNWEKLEAIADRAVHLLPSPLQRLQ